MIFKLSAIVALASALTATALEIRVPASGWAVGSWEAIAFTRTTPFDPDYFQLVLFSGESSWLVKSDIETNFGGACAFPVPDVAPGDSYILKATEIGDEGAVLARSEWLTVTL